MSIEVVFLGLGSNLGDRWAALQSGVRLLAERGLDAPQMSSVYETEPVGGPPQGPYLNAVVRGLTALQPNELLEACLDVERLFGRVREIKNGPRRLDVDILLFDRIARETKGLTVPHPRLHQRRFVLVPLAELDPEVRHPVLGLTAAEMLGRCADASEVVLWNAAVARS